MNGFSQHLTASEEVREALDSGQPVLALESTIITHGMPWPRNLETARFAAAAVREAGAAPATIAILDGVAKIGLTPRELERLAQAGTDALKCSRRDLPVLLATSATAGTTVAATMMLAHRAGIRVFATGGIGGVHRGAENSLDISADLLELARTPVAVVCAGPKAILDIGLTREYLETQGVPVVGYRTDTLPAFYSNDSGYQVDQRLESAAEIAAVIRMQDQLELMQGLVVANPPPVDAAMDADLMKRVILKAVEEAAASGVSGKAVTPYLLQRVEQLTGGASLEANIALMLNNARLGAEIAVALARHNEDS
jgi:pseudouridine-5'-phosphate glycosidase